MRNNEGPNGEPSYDFIISNIRPEYSKDYDQTPSPFFLADQADEKSLELSRQAAQSYE